MLQEQFQFCNTYRKRGEEALGSIVSLHSAFKERIEKEKRRAQLVMEAQQGTLQRLKSIIYSRFNFSLLIIIVS